MDEKQEALMPTEMPKNPQTIGEVNAIFDQVVISRLSSSKNKSGRLYFVIDKHTNMVGLTSDKAHASSIKQFAGWIDESIKHTETSGPTNRLELRNLQERLNTFAKPLPLTWLEKIKNFFGIKFESNKEAVEKVVHNIDERIAADPTYPQKVISYSEDVVGSEGKPPLKQKHVQHVQTFESISNSQNIDFNDFTNAFSAQVGEIGRLNPNWSSHKAIHSLVTAAFNDLIGSFFDTHSELSPEDMVRQFKLELSKLIEDRNHVSHMVDRDLFKDLMGIKVKGGKNRPAEEIDSTLPNIKELIKAYNEGTWKEEERLLEYDIIPEENVAKKDSILNSIFNDANFDQALGRYFEALKAEEG